MAQAPDIKTPPFDFERAVEEARRDFPKQTQHVTFLDGSRPDAFEKLYAWAVEQKMRTIQWDRMLAPWFENKNAGAIPGMNGGMLLIMHPDNPSNTFRGDADKCNHFTFDHELGHIVSPKGSGPDIDADTAENVADSFATMRGLQRGTLHKPDLERLSALRDAGFLLYSGLNHLTSMAVDAIAINPRNTDFISLTPQETARLASRHGLAFDKPPRLMEKFEKVAKIGKPGYDDDGLPLTERLEQRLHALTEICMKAKPSSMVFYLAARIVINAIDHGGATYVDEPVRLNGENPHWQDLKESILKRAGGRDIGARKALETESLSHPRDSSFIGKIRQAFTPLKI